MNITYLDAPPRDNAFREAGAIVDAEIAYHKERCAPEERRERRTALASAIAMSFVPVIIASYILFEVAKAHDSLNVVHLVILSALAWIITASLAYRDFTSRTDRMYDRAAVRDETLSALVSVGLQPDRLTDLAAAVERYGYVDVETLRYWRARLVLRPPPQPGAARLLERVAQSQQNEEQSA